jgi:hypothetical protein
LTGDECDLTRRFVENRPEGHAWKIAPAEARNARPGRIAAPRRGDRGGTEGVGGADNVPTSRSETCQSASEAGCCSNGGRSPPVDADHARRCAIVDTPASSSPDVLAGDEQVDRPIPAARAGSTRSSPSQTNSLSLSRCRRLSSLRISPGAGSAEGDHAAL